MKKCHRCKYVIELNKNKSKGSFVGSIISAWCCRHDDFMSWDWLNQATLNKNRRHLFLLIAIVFFDDDTSVHSYWTWINVFVSWTVERWIIDGQQERFFYYVFRSVLFCKYIRIRDYVYTHTYISLPGFRLTWSIVVGRYRKEIKMPTKLRSINVKPEIPDLYSMDFPSVPYIRMS